MSEAPTLWDLQHLVERNHTDLREDILDLKTQHQNQTLQHAAQFERYVLVAVYEAHHAALIMRVRSLEEEQKTARSQVRQAVFAAAGSVVATIIAAIILAVVLKGGKP